jgi:hypothetical protein
MDKSIINLKMGGTGKAKKLSASLLMKIIFISSLL